MRSTDRSLITEPDRSTGRLRPTEFHQEPHFYELAQEDSTTMVFQEKPTPLVEMVTVRVQTEAAPTSYEMNYDLIEAERQAWSREWNERLKSA